jgi:hypothetical protein
MAGVMMAQRQMSFVHPFSFEFKRLAYEAVGCARRFEYLPTTTVIIPPRIKTVVTREGG